MIYNVQLVSTTDNVVIFGHTFHGLKDIELAVEARVRKEGSKGVCKPSDIYWCKPEKAVEGIHVVEKYERYPCFDEHDYAYEKRYYSWYYFSTQPFDADVMCRLSVYVDAANNATSKQEYLPQATPSIHYPGDGDKMNLTTIEHEEGELSPTTGSEVKVAPPVAPKSWLHRLFRLFKKG